MYVAGHNVSSNCSYEEILSFSTNKCFSSGRVFLSVGGFRKVTGVGISDFGMLLLISYVTGMGRFFVQVSTVLYHV